MEPLLSIIIPTHNSEKTIERCITSLTSQSIPREQFEIIIVDDGSNDVTVNLAKKLGVDLVIETDPCFQGKARNIGAENAKSKLLAFIDSDCEAKDGWIKTAISELKNSQTISGPVYNGNPQSKVSWGEYFVEFGGFYKKRKSLISIVPGCSIACTKDAFDNAGGFSNLRLSEDVLFSKSLERLGIEKIFIPEFEIFHFCRTEKDKVSKNMKLLGRYFVRNRQHIPNASYKFLGKSRLFIPAIFLSKLSKCAINAMRGGMTRQFVVAIPSVIMAISSFCKGIWNEITEKKDSSGQ